MGRYQHGLCVGIIKKPTRCYIDIGKCPIVNIASSPDKRAQLEIPMFGMVNPPNYGPTCRF